MPHLGQVHCTCPTNRAVPQLPHRRFVGLHRLTRRAGHLITLSFLLFAVQHCTTAPRGSCHLRIGEPSKASFVRFACKPRGHRRRDHISDPHGRCNRRGDPHITTGFPSSGLNRCLCQAPIGLRHNGSIVKGSDRVAAVAISTAMGNSAATVLTILIAISILGAINGSIFSTPRSSLAMAKDGLFFRLFAKLNSKYHTPVIALVARGIWAAAQTLMGTFRSSSRPLSLQPGSSTACRCSP